MNYLFTSESVSEGHPDKVADQISDALLDEFLAYDPQSKVACETLVTTGQVVLAGEVKSRAYIDLHEVAPPRHQPHRVHTQRIQVRRRLLRSLLGHTRAVGRHQPGGGTFRVHESGSRRPGNDVRLRL